MLGEKSKSQSPCVSLKYSLKRLFKTTFSLTKKNFLIFSRHFYLSSLLILCPLLICIFLSQIQSVVDNFAQSLEVKDPIEYEISKIDKCLTANCITLGIGLTQGRTQWTDYIIEFISKHYDLQINQDIKVLEENSLTNFYDYVNANQNTVKTGLILCSKYVEITNNQFIKNIDCEETHGKAYLLLYNFTITSRNLFDPTLPRPVDHSVFSIKLAVDNAILNYESRKKNLSTTIIEAILQEFPTPKNRMIKGFDIVAVNGPLYFFIPPMLIFGLLMSEIVREKELKLRNGLSVIGISPSAFWLSWFIIALIFSFLTTNSLIFAGYFFDIDIFCRTSYLIMLIFFLTYTMTMMMLAFLLSTLIDSVKYAYTISYSFLLGGLVLQCVFQSSTLLKIFHVTSLPEWVELIRFMLSWYPPYNFTKIYNDIAVKSGSFPDNIERRWVKGPGFTWNDIFLPRTGVIKDYYYEIPSSFHSMWYLCADFCLFFVMTWYFDVTVSGNRGRAKEWWFIFSKKFWGLLNPLRGLRHLNKKPPFSSRSLTKKETCETGLKVEDLWKQYKNSSSPAVKPLNFYIKPDELVAIIGHNGAGKTTLLSMLTGLLAPSGGSASFFGYDLNNDLEKINQIIGYCPQFNILWDELTALEHLNLFAELRDTPQALRQDLINEKLNQVGLFQARHKLVGTFSGGMKRRLSVIISSIGNPSIIFMDEPTTGMDPITRREVWKLIQTLKKDRILILTSHSMQEAEILSDRILVMVNGEIKCSGNALYLKNHFGDGYKFEIVCKNTQEIWEKLQKSVKSLRLVNVSGESLCVSIDTNKVNDVQRLFTEIERLKIEDWGLRISSLEEVFMNVTGSLENL